jgi:hypothetical protein
MDVGGVDRCGWSEQMWVKWTDVGEVSRYWQREVLVMKTEVGKEGRLVKFK